VKSIMVYIANDGSRWETIKQALDRDRLIKAVESVLTPLGCTPLLEDEAVYSHDPGVVQQVRAALGELSRPRLEYWLKGQREHHGHEPDLSTVDPLWICRLLDDPGSPLSNAWGRLACIDQAGREYAQPFYARQADEMRSKGDG
jgi:hypothetical protein